MTSQCVAALHSLYAEEFLCCEPSSCSLKKAVLCNLIALFFFVNLFYFISGHYLLNSLLYNISNDSMDLNCLDYYYYYSILLRFLKIIFTETVQKPKAPPITSRRKWRNAFWLVVSFVPWQPEKACLNRPTPKLIAFELATLVSPFIFWTVSSAQASRCPQELCLCYSSTSVEKCCTS